MDPLIQNHSSTFKSSLAALFLVSFLLPAPTWAAPAVDDGDDSYRFLAGLLDKGLYDLAAKEGDSFLKNYPGHAKAELARYRLATALFELERSEEAAEHYAVLAARDGFEYRAEANFRLGQSLLSLGNTEGARSAFQQVMQLNQAYLNGPATFFLAETEFRAGEVQAAESNYQRFLSEHKDKEYLAGARRGLVWCAWNKKQADQTIQRAKAFLKSHGQETGSDEMRILLGEAYLEARQPEAALESFNQVETKEFGDARRRGAGFALAAQSQHGPAASEFALLLRDFPKSRFAAEARLQLGLQALRAGNADAAIRALLLATRDKDPEAFFWLSEAQAKQGDKSSALRALDSALGHKPDKDLQARIHAARGDLLSAMGRNAEALAAYAEGGSDYALYAAAVTSLNEGDSQNAIGLVETLLQTQPKSKYRLQAMLLRGEAHFSLAQYDKAIQAFRALLDSQADDSQSAQALGRIAWSQYQSGALQAALDSFDALNQRYPNQAPSEEGLYMLARVALESGAMQRAQQASASYLERYPEGAHHADVLFAAGQADEGQAGLSFFEQLLSRHAEHELVAAALLELGDRRSALGQNQAAREHYEELLSKHRSSKLLPEALYGLGWCLYNLEVFDQSAVQLSRVSGQANAPLALRRAALELAVWSYSKAQDARGATDAWRAYAALSASESACFESLRTVLGAWSVAGTPQKGQALLNEFLRGLKSGELATRALLESAYLALESGDVELADSQVQAAEKRSPGNAGVAEASFFVGEARFAAGDHDGAARLYEGALAEDNPMRANAFYKLGFALMKQGQLPAAAKAFGSLVREHASSELFGEALFLQGEALFRSDSLEPAIACFERLRKDAPEHQVLPKALFRLGIAQGRLELWSACETSLTLLARKAPEFQNLSEAELWRGRALAAQRKGRAARQAFERVVAMDKGELAARARLGLGALLEAEGRSDEALSEYLKVAYLYAHDEEVAEALFRAGTCLEAQGNQEQAKAQYDEVVKRHPAARFAAKAKQRLGELERSQ